MRVKMTFAVAALAALLLGLPASSYANRTVEVGAGESIQAAIDEAKPYTTIEIAEGTYAENLLINKDGIELEGEGRKKTRIVPPASPPPDVFCGICVFDVDEQFNIVHRVKDVEISHLSVTGFDGVGIFFIGTKNGEVSRTIASNNSAYGIFFNDSTGGTIARNVTGNDNPDVLPEAGIYVGDSPNADATVWKNVSYGNHDGFFIRDAANGKLLSNKAFSNCLGVVFLNTDETAQDPPGDPVDVADWLAKGNLVSANNRECPASDEAPPLSGIGIAVLGGVDIRLIANGVYGNQAPAGFASAFNGGILVVASPEFTPPKPSTGTKVGFNTALGNDPDLFWDEAGEGNAFFANDCLTSVPDGLCEDPPGDGDHGDDDHNGGDRDHGDKRHEKDKKHKGGKHKKNKKSKHKKSKKHDHDD